MIDVQPKYRVGIRLFEMKLFLLWISVIILKKNMHRFKNFLLGLITLLLPVPEPLHLPIKCFVIHKQGLRCYLKQLCC